MTTKQERASLGAQRLALVQMAVTLLGEALITRHVDGDFTVHEIAGGLYHVAQRDGKVQCTTCGDGLTAGQDRHAALVLLYVLALDGQGRRQVG